MNRWELLKPKEKEIVWRYVVLGEKRYTIGRNMGISRTYTCVIMHPVFRILGVENALELALWVGKNYEQIEMDAITLGLEMPKLEAVGKSEQA